MLTKCDNMFFVHVEGKQLLVRRAPAQAGAHCMKKFSVTHHATTICHDVEGFLHGTGHPACHDVMRAEGLWCVST